MTSRGAIGAAYRDFWAGVGERFPDLAGAASTEYLLGQRTTAVRRALPATRQTADSQDRSLGRGQEHAHPRVGQPSGRARVRRRHLRTHGDVRRAARSTPDRARDIVYRAPSATCATCRSATQASTRSTRWERSSISTRPSAPSARWLACSSPAGAPSSACRTAATRFSGRCSSRCSRQSASTDTDSRSPTLVAR